MRCTLSGPFLKNKTLVPLWTGRGRPTLCVLMTYKCHICSGMFLSNDRRVLHIQLAYLKEVYPVEPKFCSGSFHFDLGLTDDMQALMKTYANGSFISKEINRKMNIQYTRKLGAYLSIPNLKDEPKGYVAFSDWCEGLNPPSAKAIRQYSQDGFYCNFTNYSYSDNERCIREIQNVSLEDGETVAVDHTFQTVKNYNLPGAKTHFTANTGRTKEILGLALVEGTAADAQVSHFLVQLMKKKKPAVLYHDTCPNNSVFWTRLFGKNQVHIRLGLFHLIHRIVDTLDKRSDLYWEALKGLKEAIYHEYCNEMNSFIRYLVFLMNAQHCYFDPCRKGIT